MTCSPLRAVVVGLVLIGGLVPPALYMLMDWGVTSVGPDEAKAILQGTDPSGVLVDVRPPAAFWAGHLDGAINWPLTEILAAKGAGDVPPSLRGKTLLVVCDVGISSRTAARHLAAAGIAPVKNVRGGIQEWIHAAHGATAQPAACWRTSEGPGEHPSRPSSPLKQALAVLAFFFIKPIYTLLSLLMVIVLWGRREGDLAALRWAMIFFFLGENACAVNYFVFREDSYVMEYLHSFGMLLCFSFTAYAVLEGIDRRLIMVSDPQRRCAAMGLCGGCIKQGDVPCGLLRTFCVILAGLIVLTLMLPTADWHNHIQNTRIFDQPYCYTHLLVFQLFENWYCAGAAAVMLGVSLSIALVRGHAGLGPAKVAMAAGLGPLGFGALRMVLGSAYDQNRVWYLVWEEGTEMLFIAAVCCVLAIFHRRLLAKEA